MSVVAPMTAFAPAGADIAALLDLEASLLDGRLFEAWLELLTEDAWNWIPLHPGQRDPLDGPSHLYDTRDALLARIYRLKDPQNLPQQPASRCSRIVGRAQVVPVPAGAKFAADRAARAPLHLIEAQPHRDADDAMRIFAGAVTYGLVGAGDALRIRWRRVDLINSEKGLHGVSILI